MVSRPPRPRRRAREAAALASLALASVLISAPAPAQQIVWDPRNQVENALQAARQLESLANEAAQLANEARMLARSPYSHLEASSSTLRDMGELARTVRGVASTVEGVERQFEALYGEDPGRLSDERLRAGTPDRARTARRSAEDLARTAAELERLSRGRDGRLAGALGASRDAVGQTAAIQSSTQMLAVLAEDLGAVRAALLAQSRLMAAAAAGQAADREAARETRRRFWDREAVRPAAPAFDPFARARD